jgi:hypothetical protein
MTSKQNIEGALLLDEVPLKRCQNRFAVINRQAKAAVGQILEVLLDFKFATLSASDLIGPFNTDFPTHSVSPLQRFAVSKTQFDRLCTPDN